MKNASFAALLEHIALTFAGAVRAVATMSWPGLMASCLALALAITIMPLALFLFIVFMAVKLAAGLIVVKHKAGEDRRASE
jgi:hypothetical protein